MVESVLYPTHFQRLRSHNDQIIAFLLLDFLLCCFSLELLGEASVVVWRCKRESKYPRWIATL